MLYREVSQPAHLSRASFPIMPISVLAPPIDPNIEILNQHLWKSEPGFPAPAQLQVRVDPHLSPSLPLTEGPARC